MKSFLKISVLSLAVLLIASFAFADTNRLGGDSKSFNPTNSVTKTAAYTAVLADSEIKVNATSAAITITLPTMDSVTSGRTKVYKIVKTDSSTNMVTVAAGSGSTIGGEASRKLINQNDYMIISSGPGGSSRDWTIDFESSYLAENHYAGTVALVGGANVYNLYTTSATSTTLTSAYCGRTIGFTGQATMTLPTSIANCQIRFMVAQAPATMVVLPYTGQKILGAVATNAAFAGTASIGIRASSYMSTTGANATLMGDGTNWFVIGGGGQAVWGLP